MKYITIHEYCRNNGIKNPQVIYNKIAMMKLKKGEDWIEKEITVKRKYIRDDF